MKNKIKTPLALRIVAWTFPKVEFIAPWLAKRWFVKIFFSTAKYKLPYGEVEAADKAMKYKIEFEQKSIQVYEWGEGKPVLMMHGWMGRSTQFRKFIASFNAAGYKVVAFDATGHGGSEGNQSHIMEFAAIIQLLGNRYSSFDMIIGHSLGGVAALHAITQGVDINKLVMISSPTIGSEIMNEFMKKIGASNKMLHYFEAYILNKFGQKFIEYSAEYAIDKLSPIDLLLIYDKDDAEVSLLHPSRLIEKYPAAELIITEGLGHTRILKDAFVIEKTLNFLLKKKYTKNLSAEAHL